MNWLITSSRSPSALQAVATRLNLALGKRHKQKASARTHQLHSSQLMRALKQIPSLLLLRGRSQWSERLLRQRSQRLLHFVLASAQPHNDCSHMPVCNICSV
jgi:hypothetical protein